MKGKHKAYLKLNLMSIFFIAISFVSVTLAWFAYSGIARVATEVNVKAWHIELEKNGDKVSNEIVVSLSDIYPGMDVVHEVVNIKNLGDSDASINYSVISARILGSSSDNYIIDDDDTTSEYVENILSHNYPFHINISLSRRYILSKQEDAYFEVSVSWPLDSDTDDLDSLWGSLAYTFQSEELEKRNANENYQIRPSIQILINLSAEQYIENDKASDINYNMGDIVLYDPINNKKCNEIGNDCISTYIIDANNTLENESVTLLPNPKSEFLSGLYEEYDSIYDNTVFDWNVETRKLTANDLLKVISTDIMDSYLVRDGLSDLIVGKMIDDNTINEEINKLVPYSGYYRFKNQKFNYISSSNCYWTYTDYNMTTAFAIKKLDEDSGKIYGEEKHNTCKVIPVIIVPKSKLK